MTPITPEYYRWAILKALHEDRSIVPHTLYEGEIEQTLGVPWNVLQEDAKFLASKGYIIIAKLQRGSRIYCRLTLEEQGRRFIIEGGVIDTEIAVPDVTSDTLAATRQKGTQPAIEAHVNLLYDHLPTGVLDLYDQHTMPVVRFALSNHSSIPIRFTVESQIEDFSYKRVDSLDAQPGTECVVAQLPRLQRERSQALNEIRRAVLYTQVTYQHSNAEHPLARQTFDLFLMARNVVRWAVPDAEHPGSWIPLLDHVAAWVTPRDENVKLTLREAADLHPDHHFVGYQGLRQPDTARRQAQAIYGALKSKYQLTYINATFAIGCGNLDVVQTIRLPRESLSMRSANCIDGAVLYASLMEAADLEPIIVLLSGHAFVGWKTWEGSQDYEFLETTMTLRAPFQEAFEEGMAQYRQLVADGWFAHPVFDPHGFARLLDIKALHNAGIYPMD